MPVRLLLVYHCFMFRLNKVEICFSEIHICMYLWESRGTKNI